MPVCWNCGMLFTQKFCWWFGRCFWGGFCWGDSSLSDSSVSSSLELYSPKVWVLCDPLPLCKFGLAPLGFYFFSKSCGIRPFRFFSTFFLILSGSSFFEGLGDGSSPLLSWDMGGFTFPVSFLLGLADGLLSGGFSFYFDLAGLLLPPCLFGLGLF